jgi:hypothetical protein
MLRLASLIRSDTGVPQPVILPAGEKEEVQHGDGLQ